MKICLAASSGGHLEEIAQLSNIIKEYDCFLFTENNNFVEKHVCQRVYYTKQINRSDSKILLKLLKLIGDSYKVLKKEKPDCIISTGALATYPLCLLAKIMGRKIIYIESFARIEEGSLTGRLIYKFADLFIVQWEDMLKVYPKAKFGGGIF